MATKRKYRLTEEEAKLIDNYRAGVQETIEPEEEDQKEEKEMKQGTKKTLKIAGIVTAGAAVLGGLGYGIYKWFFEDPSGLDDFDDAFEDEDSTDNGDDDLFEEDKSE